jgi:hypothetical protein
MLNGRARWRACARHARRLTTVTVYLGSGGGNRVETRRLCCEHYMQ